METAIVIVALIAFVGFRQLLAYHRREQLHRERMLAMEKGIALPPMEPEVRRSNINVQRILLLAGLIWISLGIATFVVLNVAQTSGQQWFDYPHQLPRGIQYVAIAPIGIGISHLIVLLVGRNKVS
jgi:hypothetical protein